MSGEQATPMRSASGPDARPLAGLRIAVTRPREQAEKLEVALRERGAEPVRCPTIRIAAAGEDASLRRAAEELSRYDWVVFTSANGVRRFWEELEAGGRDASAFRGTRVAAIGPGTAAALKRHGLEADLVPEEYVAESVADSLIAREELAGKRVLLPRASGAREVLPDRLRSAGAEVDQLVAYESLPDSKGIARLREEIAGDGLDMVTFTAASTVNAFVDLAGPKLGRARVATIGPITAAAARSAGLRVDVVAEEYTIEGLVDAICEHYRSRGRS